MSLEQTEPEQVEDSVAEETAATLEPVEAEQVAEEPAAVEAGEPEVAAVEEPVAEEVPAQVAEDAAPEEPVEAAAEEPSVAVDEVVAETPAAEPQPGPEPSPEPAVIVATELPKVPFVIYDVVWLAFSGLLAWLLSVAPKDVSTYSLAVYPVALGLGVVLAIAGPVLALIVWMSARRAPWHRSGMFAQAMLWGALATLIGIVLWWAGLSIGDFLRLR